MEGFNWNSSNFNNFEYSWDQHPNFFTNIQDNNIYPSFSPPHQDWNDTFTNTFDQSWEENYDYSCNFQRSDPCYGFTPFDPNYPSKFFSEQPEPSHSFETFSPNLIETFTTFLGDFTSSIESLNNKMGQLVDELKNQRQGPLPSVNEKLNCVGKDESDIKKGLEIFEANFEHMSKPSLLLNSEEVLQDAKIYNLTKFAHVVQPSLCDDNTPKMVTVWTIGRICVIKSSEVLPKLCCLGGRFVARIFGIMEVSVILKPLHLLKMHMWGGESHPT